MNNPLSWFMLLLVWVFVAAELSERGNQRDRIVLAILTLIFGAFCLTNVL